MKKVKSPLAIITFVVLLAVGCSKDDEPKSIPAELTVDHSSIDFNEVKITSLKNTKVEIVNTGGEELILKKFTLSGTSASEFSINVGDAEKTLQAKEAYELVVTFMPTAVGDKTATLTITSNVGEHKISLLGKGAPEPTAVYNIDAESKDFGDVMMESEVAHNFTITNTGEAGLTILEATLDGPHAEDYTTTIAPVTIQPSEALVFEVKFMPKAMGNKTATLSMVTNVGAYAVELVGNGISNPEIVYVPDANFKASLLAHGTGITGNGISKIDKNDDGKIQVSEARSYYGTIACIARSITDLTGIEEFVNLTKLNVQNNQLSVLDVSNNTGLEAIQAYSNVLTDINVSRNTALEQLHLSDNKLSTLDVSNNTALKNLWVERNKLTDLDVSKNTELVLLVCRINQLSDLDISQNTKLEELECGLNKLTSLDVTSNISLDKLEVEGNMLGNLDVSLNVALEELLCNDNELTNINISNNTALKKVWVHNNALTSLDVSKNAVLEFLHCYGNELTSLNLVNGNNNGLIRMLAYFNDLTCIQIDAGFTPPVDGSWDKDDTAEYSTTDCP